MCVCEVLDVEVNLLAMGDLMPYLRPNKIPRHKVVHCSNARDGTQCNARGVQTFCVFCGIMHLLTNLN